MKKIVRTDNEGSTRMDDAVGTLISETALVKAEKAEVADIREESSLAQIIMRAARDPQIDVEKMERLLAMHERITAEQRQTAFMAALAAVAPKLPPILKKGRIVIPGQPARKYALLEDIDRAIRPIISTEGFSLSFDTQPAEGGKIRVICRLSHRAGHSEVKQLDLPVDKSGSKNDAQAIVSTVSYGRRTLTKMFFNLIEAGEDDDGMGGSKPITKEQAAKLRAELAALKVNEIGFLRYMAADKIENILARDWQKATNFIETKRLNANP